MRVSRHKIRLLYILLLTLLAIPITARADDDDQDDDYDVKARVVRVSLLGGEVNLKRNGNKDWEPARLNYPLVEGDTIATSKDSNLEIQIDARNFVRLAANSVLRIITLRDEGIAISVVEGTVTVRLAKFDRSKNGYFEIDAPKTTMAAEKNGLYRIDVPRDGRVRLTVRDGGTARIYSDTSGFTLRDGRSAELVVTGENTGDWEFVAAAPSDAVDAWVSDRERDLAQRFKYDVKYFDESVWGGEDLEAYGDWNHTDEFGWIWRPHASVISGYNDWAPYRYGSWTWVPPYGWTWIGDEPFGWAPYHYGRWVYHNNYWAWAPRSQYVRRRSWWRPALVAFNFSFGNDICWYPLSYYQRDPHSRHYRRDNRYRDRDGDRDRGPGYGRGGDGRRDGRHYGDPRGVTRVPRRDFGNPERRGQAVAEPVARRVVDLDPERGDRDLPHRERWGRGRNIEIPERRTGAAERAPGVALDEDLRRSRVFRGREPRAREREVAQPAVSTPTTTPATNAETPPTGAVARPEPRPRRDREPRSEPPGTPDQPRRYERPEAERRERRRERDETAPTSAPEQPRAEQPAPVSEPPRETPRENPRFERRERESAPESRPRPEPRAEPRAEPRSEPRESRPEPRTESPRSERSESPRSQPSRSESPRSESPRSEAPRSEPPRSEAPRSEPPRSEAPRSEAPRSDPPRSESPRSESPRSEPPRAESPRTAPDRPDRPNL